MLVATPAKKKAPARRSVAASKKKSTAESLWVRHQRDFIIILTIIAGLFIGLAELAALGPTGSILSRALSNLLGMSRWLLPPTLLLLGGGMLWGKIDIDRTRLSVGLPLFLLTAAGLAHLGGGRPGVHSSVSALGAGGGWLGVVVGGSLNGAIGSIGATILLVGLLIVAVIVATGVTLRVVVAASAAIVKLLVRRVSQWWTSRPEPSAPSEGEEAPAEQVPPTAKRSRAKKTASQEKEATDELVANESDGRFEEAEVEPEVVPPPARLATSKKPSEPTGQWVLPPISLLQRVKQQKMDRSATDAAGVELVAALAAHGVETTLVGSTVGPTVTRFEIELGAGVKVARVTSLHRDIAYAMASPDVRILAPIPGRSAIGVEVPNRVRTLVALGDLLVSEEAVSANHPLDVPLGRDISGATVIVNLAEMPHVLISGATGAGKSSCINGLITSLVMRATPDILKLILIDPKRVELGQYNDLPHLLTPVVVDPKKAAGALAWAVKEMERRYDILSEYGVRDITSYQALMARGAGTKNPSVREVVAEAVERATGLETVIDEFVPETLPYIVIVVDELNDLMMVAARDVEDSVVRIAQMARAVGIHLVLATQRPSVDVITGVIKANIPSRMAFAVSSLADSRVILDQQGAERLIGKGDMLLLTASSNVARRLQCPWISEEEVRRVVENWRGQGGTTEKVIALTPVGASSSTATSGGSGEDDDELLRQARDIVIRTQSGSTSMLQRKLRVGFARAGRLMDLLEQEGVVAPGDGSKSRRVLVGLETLDVSGSNEATDLDSDLQS
jgi:S-DNA-T family DNA segregation ATPase FtsK/SpoIIIE